MKKKKTSDIFSFPKAGANDLIVFSIYSVIENQEECTFERLVKECFDLFPQLFGFSKYPKWPDARKLDRPLRMLRNRKLISGDPQTCFLLTKAGERIAQDLAKTFHQRKLFK